MILLGLDIIGAISGIIGAILVMHLKKNGYICFGICNIAYGTLGFIEGHYGLVIVSIVMFIIDVIGYIKWYREGR